MGRHLSVLELVLSGNRQHLLITKTLESVPPAQLQQKVMLGSSAVQAAHDGIRNTLVRNR
jgi:hypothetical protein